MKTLRYLLPIVACVLLVSARAAEQPKTAADAPNHGFKIHRTSAVQYPIALLRDGIAHGEARVLLNVNSEGHLVESLVVAFTQEPFAKAALEAIRQWTYEPARVNGEPVGTIVDCSFRFDVSGVLMVERFGTSLFEKRDTFGDNFVYRPYGMTELDRIPTPQHVEEPVYTKEWIEQGMRGQVAIDFYIDEKGAVHMPSVATTANPHLAAAAIAAVSNWRFAPPTHKGRPVLAHCEQVFNFEPAPAKP
jgi:TonB family protein